MAAKARLRLGDSPIILSSILICMTTTWSTIGDVRVMNIHQMDLSTEFFFRSLSLARWEIVSG